MATGARSRVLRVETFAVGIHHGERYDPRDLDRIVKNFNALCSPKSGTRPRYRVPVVLGHEEGQEWLRRTDLPAAGWVTRAYHDGRKLFTDWAGVAPEVVDLLDAGQYRTVSAELYPDFEDQGRRYGLALRRVAMLGGEVPEVKGLADIPPAVHSENATVPVVLCFAEVSAMDRATIEDQLRGAGFSDDEILALSGLDDEALGQFALAHMARQSGAAPAAAPPGEPAPMADEPGAAAAMPDRDSMIADLVASGEDADALAAMTDEELFALWQTKQGQMSDFDVSPAVAAAPARPGTPAPLPAATPTKVTLNYAEQRLRRLVAQQRAFEADLRRRERAVRHQTVRAHCERWLRDGYILPRDADARSKVPNLYHRLIHASGARVLTFGERKLSEFDAMVAEVEARGPGYVRFFAEKLAQPHGQRGDAKLDKAEADAKAYAARRNGKKAV